MSDVVGLAISDQYHPQAGGPGLYEKVGRASCMEQGGKLWSSINFAAFRFLSLGSCLV